MVQNPSTQLALHWHASAQEMEAAFLDGHALRVERVIAPTPLDAMQELMTQFAPTAGVRLLISWTSQGLAWLLPKRHEPLLSLISQCGALWEDNNINLLVSPLEHHSFVRVAQRRGISHFLGVIATHHGNAVVACEARGKVTESSGDWARIRENVKVSIPGRVDVPLRSLAENFSDLKKTRIDDPNRAWIAGGARAGIDVLSLAERHGVKSVLIPAHAGAAAAVGMLMVDALLQKQCMWRGLPIPGDETHSQEDRLRAIYRDLMDEVANDVTRMGYDTDDVECKRIVLLLPAPDCPPNERRSVPRLEPLPFFKDVAEIEASSGGSGRAVLCGAMVLATVELRKPILPPVAVSSTIVGAGEPDNRIVIGPGTMPACLCEIEVPAGWKAEWEPCGDAVMTRT